MMHMPWVVVLLIVFIILMGGGVFLAVRLMGAGAVKRDHPH